MDDLHRQISAEHDTKTSGPCRRCGTVTTERFVLRAGEHSPRASLWLCSRCHQPRHRAEHDSGGDTAPAEPSHM